MPRDHNYPQFSLGCWINPESVTDADGYENSDSKTDLRARVPILLKAGRYKCLLLYRLNPNSWKYDEIG